jgi:hypothetical protein
VLFAPVNATVLVSIPNVEDRPAAGAPAAFQELARRYTDLVPAFTRELRRMLGPPQDDEPLQDDQSLFDRSELFSVDVVPPG